MAGAPNEIAAGRIAATAVVVTGRRWTSFTSDMAHDQESQRVSNQQEDGLAGARPTSSSEPLSLEHFWPLLSQEPVVVKALQGELGPAADRALEALRSGGSLAPWGGAVEDTITDVVHNQAKEARSIQARGGYGTFYIKIMRLGPVFWIFAPEFDDVGFFGTEDGAAAHATFAWDGYIEAYEEWLRDGGEEGEWD